MRCPDNFLEMGLFREYNGIVSHTGHSESDGDNFHIMWKSLKTSAL